MKRIINNIRDCIKELFGVFCFAVLLTSVYVVMLFPLVLVLYYFQGD